MVALETTASRVSVGVEAWPRLRVACLPPPLGTNPYQRLLYAALEGAGAEVVQGWPLTIASAVRSRDRLDVLHLHWPEGYYRPTGAWRPLRPFLASLLLARLMMRLAFARLMGYRLVWTVHQVLPHEPVTPRLDRVAARLLASLATALIAHDRATTEQLGLVLGRRALAKTTVIPHGPYTGVYPAGRTRSQVRSALGLDEDAVVLLAFGHVRAYKSLAVLIEAFAHVRAGTVSLVVAGMPISREVAAAVEQAAAADSRIVPLLRFVPDADVRELFEAADVAVFARADGGTSGSLVLALSLGLPVLAADTGSTVELVGEAGWLYPPGDAAALAAVVDQMAANPADVRRRTIGARARAASISWHGVAETTLAVYRRSS